MDNRSAEKRERELEAKRAWDMFHESIKLLRAICERDNVTLKITIPLLGKKAKKK